MKYNIKTYIPKLLIALMTLVPTYKTANAKDKSDYQLDAQGENSICISAGFEFLLPSRIVNTKINATDLEGFNHGGFLEVGFQNWSGQHGNTNYEIHYGISGRAELQHLHSRAYNVNDAINARLGAGETNVWVDPTNIGCSEVTEWMGLLNLNSGIGWSGFTFESVLGVGMHADNHNNYGMVVAIGTGAGVRVNKNIKITAMYRLNTFPFEKFRHYGGGVTNPGLRHNMEIGLIYNFHNIKKRQK